MMIPLLLIAACQGARQTSITMWLQPDTPTLVNFPLTASAEVYTFSANPAAPTQITLYPMTPNLPYTAEVHDNRGAVIASVGSSLQNAVLTIGPGDGLYEVAIKSDNNQQQGMLSVRVVSFAQDAAPSYASVSTETTDLSTRMVTFAENAVECSAHSSSGGNVNIRNGPGMGYSVIGSLAGGSSIMITGQADNNWFPVSVNNQRGWISGTVITVGGACDKLPLTAATAVPPVPPTLIPTLSDAFHLDIDRDSWGDFSEKLAYGDLNRRDFIQISVVNLSNTPDTSYREFTLTLICSGTGTEDVRWGAPDNPALKCGSSFVMPFTPYYSHQTIAVSLSNTNSQAAVDYTLLAAKR